MTGHELVRTLRELARQHRESFEIPAHRGKGSHQMILLGRRSSVVPDLRKELRAGTLATILKNLGVTRAQLGKK